VLTGFRLAVTTFTVVPLRAGAIDRTAAGWAMRWAPVVGGFLGGLGALVFAGARWLFSPDASRPGALPFLLASVLAITTLAMLTRGLHLDGLADTVDGLASHRPAEDALAIMSTGPVGALGAAALVVVLVSDVVALAAAAQTGNGVSALVVAVVTGRLAMVWACTTRVPSARSAGLGAMVAGTVSAGAAWLSTAVVTAAAATLGWATGQHTGAAAGRSAASVVAALVVAWALRRHAQRRLGGITGDVLGALGEVTTLVALLIAAISVQ